MREKIEYFIVLSVIKISKFLPKFAVFALLKFFAIILFWVLKSRRKLAINNILAAYKDFDFKKAKSLAKANFISISQTVAEVLLLINDRIKLDDVMQNGESAVKKVKELTKNNKNGIIFVTAHFGNWEFLAHYFATKGFPVSVVGRYGNNSLIEDNITFPFRHKFGNDLIYKDDAMRNMIKLLKNHGNLGILTDQKTGNFKAEFFGRKCYTTKSVATLFLKFNPVIIPIFAKRIDKTKFEIIVEKFPEIPSNLSKNEAELFITQTCNDIFENIVRSAPEQWFWMHNRWRMDA
ncbi:lysophospholipid acyltransferase family protein [Campylobacter hominis]|uniref:Acyltransferase n=1 Tax=Campylobacter hominis (strain ATCC BAA-381 / DSM 21671 / CCUG 45161 / LMG 19568 / NCTC 13146 / CH001A) TaxID=360107 RepID=A7I146_CAMHC|nr:lysophospholipid acyltransferase family protein [Campylobacter hominis]ABS51777.1 acyltransferase [Campylobacter hominis ATCC BAA-381]UAK86445.1 lysophospholipid acyltransferase family protein [Campylobacter hominis]SUW84775.1 acyltransferase [Campylobacter hominis]